jgi:hypothetical protein
VKPPRTWFGLWFRAWVFMGMKRSEIVPLAKAVMRARHVATVCRAARAHGISAEDTWRWLTDDDGGPA